MRTLVIGGSWITKYYIGDRLYNDSNNEDLIQVLTPETHSEFFATLPTLKEFIGDERLNVANESISDIDLKYVDNILFDPAGWNNDTSWRFFDYVIKQNPEMRLVLLSTWEVYDWQSMKMIPIHEYADNVTHPETDFGVERQLQENQLKNNGLNNWVILRLCDVFGPYKPYQDDIYRIIKQALTNQTIVIDQPAGRCLDITYVTNITNQNGREPSVITKALSKEGIDRQIYNIGSENERKITNIARSIQWALNSGSKIEISDENTDEFLGKGFHSQLHTGRAAKDLNWFNFTETLKGFIQTAMWIESTLSPEERVIDPIVKTYPTLDKNVKKVSKDGKEYDLV